MKVILVIVLTALAVPCEADMLGTASRYKSMHERSISFLGINPGRVSWCGAFLAFVAKRSSRQPPPNPNMAASWRTFGQPVGVRSARRGDVVVIRTGRRFHVSLFDHIDPGRQYVYLFGGNQSNRVQLSRYRASSVVAVRR
ncbi:MAG: TIGR02594 family protein [Rhizobium sp.]|uniref:TIGR02594 family protein n=1 Tax=Rhizobium sp. TaxID=391 RepID=UPI00389A6A47